MILIYILLIIIKFNIFQISILGIKVIIKLKNIKESIIKMALILILKVYYNKYIAKLSN
jgi:hypothetical protein